MAKLNFTTAPTFTLKVAIPVPGKKAVDVEFTFKGRNREEFREYLRVVRGWAFDPDGREAAVLKGWVESRFGLMPRHHGESLREAGSPVIVVRPKSYPDVELTKVITVGEHPHKSRVLQFSYRNNQVVMKPPDWM